MPTVFKTSKLVSWCYGMNTRCPLSLVTITKDLFFFVNAAAESVNCFLFLNNLQKHFCYLTYKKKKNSSNTLKIYRNIYRKNLLAIMWQLRARWTLLYVVHFISHTKSGCFSTCFIDSVIFYLFPILSHVFRYLFIISSSVLEQAGFFEIEGVISSNPTWQCLYFFFFCIDINLRAC